MRFTDFFIGIETNIDAFRSFYEFFATQFWVPQAETAQEFKERCPEKGISTATVFTFNASAIKVINIQEK